MPSFSFLFLNYIIAFAADEEDIDGVSVGGMDVSDIEDDQGTQPSMTSRQPQHGQMSNRSRNSNLSQISQSGMQPRPPPRYPPPKQGLSQSAVSKIQPAKTGAQSVCCK